MDEYYDAQTGELITEYEAVEAYDVMLDEVYGTVEVVGMTYDTSRALKELDPIAYRCGFNDWIDGQLLGGAWTETAPEAEAELRHDVMATGTFWVCTDCLWADQDINTGTEPHHVPFNLWNEVNIFPGAPFDPDSSECGHSSDVADDCDAHSESCETINFATFPCEGCGCRLAGTRYAYTYYVE